jgi:hypothetical protein
VVVQFTVVDAAAVPLAETAIVADCVDDETYCGRRARELAELALGTTIRKLTLAVRPADCGAADDAGAGTAAWPPPPPHAERNRLEARAAPSGPNRACTRCLPPTSSRR